MSDRNPVKLLLRRKVHMRILIACLVSAVAGAGATIPYQATFTSDTLQSCFIVCTADPLPPGAHDQFTATFSLDSSALAANGTYDVTPSFSSVKLIPSPFTGTGLTTSGSVGAIVSGGAVTGLTSSGYQVFYVFEPTLGWSMMSTLRTSGTNFRLNTLTQAFRTGNTSEDGNIAIQALTGTPEPASFVLVALALSTLGLLAFRLRHPSRV